MNRLTVVSIGFLLLLCNTTGCFAVIVGVDSSSKRKDAAMVQAAAQVAIVQANAEATGYEMEPGRMADLAESLREQISGETPKTIADEIEFVSTSTDADGDTLTCSWVFPSGTPTNATSCTVSGVTFPNFLPYMVRLTVDDGNGNTAMVTIPIGPCT